MRCLMFGYYTPLYEMFNVQILCCTMHDAGCRFWRHFLSEMLFLGMKYKLEDGAT